MKKLLFSLSIGLSISVSIPTFAQEDINGGPINSRTETGVIDGVVLSTHIPTKRLIPYEHVREADVIWSKRVWRTLDMREKMNHSIYFPHDEFTAPDVETGEVQWIRNSSRWSLWTIIRHHIINGDLTVYSDYNPAWVSRKDGDEFKYPILPDPGKDYFTDSVYRDKMMEYLADLGPLPEDPLLNEYGEDSIGTDGNPVYPPRDIFWVQSKDVIQYKIKEDWFFDKERSVLDVRILGICPVRYDIDVNNPEEINGTLDMFWLYFPTDCRYVFNNYFVYNEKNGSRWMSFDDFFWKRRFSSFIHKEENVFDRKIEKYRVGLDALRESDNIRENIRKFEHDLWSF
jgi:gliding motility associated protien GldN